MRVSFQFACILVVVLLLQNVLLTSAQFSGNSTGTPPPKNGTSMPAQGSSSTGTPPPQNGTVMPTQGSSAPGGTSGGFSQNGTGTPPPQSGSATPTPSGSGNGPSGTPSPGHANLGAQSSASVDRLDSAMLPNYNISMDNTTQIDPEEADRNAQRSYSPETNSTEDRQNFTFAGTNGMCKLSAARSGAANQTSNQTNYTIVKFRRLSDCQGQRALNFETASWTWSNPINVTLFNVSCTSVSSAVNATVILVNGTNATVSFNVTAYMFNAAAKIPYGTSSVSVGPNTVKFSYTISNWPFNVSSNCSLYMGLTMASNGNSINQSGYAVNVGTGSFSTAGFGIADNNMSAQVPVSTLSSVDADTGGQVQGEILTVIPQFNSNFFYDPVVSSDTTTVSTTTSSPTAAPVSSGSTSSPTSSPTKAAVNFQSSWREVG